MGESPGGEAIEVAGLIAGAVRSNCARNGEDLRRVVAEVEPRGGVLMRSSFRISTASGVAKLCLSAAFKAELASSQCTRVQ